ncbi:DUF2332 domain-containing protein [Halorussus halophilus]|uniref:DUF2332 domain-containing protein n=1 Tax=Halorussus halophilus TaxID=2650975 RepID=UPI0013018D49|nr:DUF2332 domain-containing protein [Halorussus halophilus]
MNEAEQLREQFRSFADWCVGTSPLYERLARGVADDSELLALAAETPDGRSPPHLLLAGVQYLLFERRDHELADFYPSVTTDATDPDEEDPFPAFREFALENADEIRDLLASRRTQTNAVRRCAALMPAFEVVSRRANRRPLALVEVGPSAGLNLLWGRYCYDYGSFGRYGNSDSPVVLESEVRGESTPPFPENDGLPPVESRVGLDLNPLDVTDDADALWLRSLVWPEHDERHDILDGAIEVARREPPELREGDALELLPDALAEIPPETPVCVFDTQVRYQFSDEMRERFDDLLLAAGENRELYSLSGDLTADWAENGIVLTLQTVEDGTFHSERLATYEQHGRWVEWVSEP